MKEFEVSYYLRENHKTRKVSEAEYREIVLFLGLFGDCPDLFAGFGQGGKRVEGFIARNRADVERLFDGIEALKLKDLKEKLRAESPVLRSLFCRALAIVRLHLKKMIGSVIHNKLQSPHE